MRTDENPVKGIFSWKIRGSIVGIYITLFFCLLATGAVIAQSTFGTVLGTVKDASGSAVPNAVVKLINLNENTIREVVSNSDGDYEVVNVKPGLYKVEVSATGFETTAVTGLTLVARQTLRADVSLQVGKVTQVVEVQGSSGVIATETQTISSSFGSQKILNLPANYRASGSTSPYILISTLPGVQADNGNNFSIQGGLPSQSQFSVDGISITDVTGNAPLREAFPSAESIAEIKVQGVGNAAEYGQVGDVTVVSKSGTNDVHGSVFWFHQNRALDATAYGARTKPQKIGNNFGITGGGPVMLPWLYNGRNRTFFFGSFEGFTFPRGATIQNAVPTQAMRDGDLSAWLNLARPIQIKDPITGQAFAGNRIPTNRISPIAKAILGLYPLPNNGSSPIPVSNNFVENRSQNYDSRQFDIRGDHYFGTNQQIYGRFTWKNIDQEAPTILTLPSRTQLNETRSMVLSHNYAIRPNLTNEARFGFTLSKSGQTLPFDGAGFTNSLGLQGIGPSFPFNGLPNINVNNEIQTLGINRGDSISKARTFQFNNNTTWSLGRHTMKFGFDLRRMRAVTPLGFLGADNYGNFTFNGSFTGLGFSDFLLGVPISTSYARVQQDNDGQTTHYHFFGQDNFKVSQRLTLEYGLRVEIHPAYNDASGNIGNFDPTVARTGRVVYPTGKQSLLSPGYLKSFNACPAPAANGIACTPVVSAEEAGLPEGLRESPVRVLPRLGFAWRPFGNDKTAVRGGIGLYNGTILGSIYYSLTGTLQSDTRIFQNINAATGQPIFTWPQIQTSGDGITSSSLGTAYFGTANEIQFKEPLSTQWNLSIDRYIGWNTGLRISYIGMKTNHLVWAPNLNDMTPSTQFAIQRPLTDRPFPNWGVVNTRAVGANAFYNALQMDLVRQFRNGVTFNSTYTWAKNLADNGGPTPGGFAGETAGGRTTSLYDRGREYGDVYATRRHRFITTGVFELPVGKGRRYLSSTNRLIDGILGGWSTSTILLLQTGPYLTPTFSGGDPSGSGSGNLVGRPQHPDRIADGNLSNPTRDQWIDKNAFVCPGVSGWQPGTPCTVGVNPARDVRPIGRFGNSGIGVITGPGTINLSMGLSKAFAITEKIRLEASGSFTNLPNRVNLADPVLNITSANFGRITSARGSELGGSRTGQVSMRLIF